MNDLDKKAKRNLYMREYLKKNSERINSNRKKRYIETIEVKKAQSLAWRLNNKELKAKLDKEYQEENKEKIALNKRAYYENNREHFIKVNCARTKSKRKIDVLYNLKSVLRTRIIVCLINRKYKKSKTTEDLLGADICVVRDYLESLFEDGMTWDNHGMYGWHVDHKIPLASANNEEEIYNLFNYKNLQPLWAKDNLKKGSKLINTTNFELR